MAKNDPDTVLLHRPKDDPKDGVASGTVTPGDHLEYTGEDSNGDDQLQRNSEDGAVRGVKVAREYAKAGKGIDDDYADGEHLEYEHLESGDVFYGFVFDGGNASTSDGTSADDSGNANISDGDKLVAYSGSGQDGTFRNLDTGNGDEEGAALVEAKEAVDNSSGTDPARIKLEVI